MSCEIFFSGETAIHVRVIGETISVSVSSLGKTDLNGPNINEVIR